MAAAKVYKEKDANKNVLKKKTIAVIGYGALGRANALNLKDGGFAVSVGLRKGSASATAAKKDGFKVFSIADAVKNSDVILIAVPDMCQGELFETQIAPNLEKNKTLVFAHGLSVHWGFVKPPEGVDVILVAPKAPAGALRSQFLEGRGVPAFIGVHSGGREARALALAWADAIGSTRAAVVETTFKEEAETDLFGEQAVIGGGLAALVRAGFETLVKAGYRPEVAYFECCHELKSIADLIYQSGISGMRFSVSETARYGDATRGSRVVGSSSRREMERILREIQSGRFVKEWVGEYKSGMKKCKKLLAQDEKHPIEKVGQRLRALMPWVAKQNLKGARAHYSSEMSGAGAEKSVRKLKK